MIATLPASELVVLLVRYGLAAVFLAAAVAKARDLNATRSAAVSLGVPEPMAPAVSVGLVVTEVAIAVCLVIAPLAGFAAAAALLLLIVFSLVVAGNLRAGRRPACNCFGQQSSAPIGYPTLLRNGILATASAAVVAFGFSGDGVGRVQRLSTTQAVTTGAVIVALALYSWVLLNLIRQNGQLLLRLDRLEATFREPEAPVAITHRPMNGQRPIGRKLTVSDPAPRFLLKDVDGRTVTIDDLLGDGRPVVLVFLETNCAACVELAREINDGVTSPDRNLVAVVSGQRDAVSAAFSGPGFDMVLVDAQAATKERYGVAGTPTAMLVLPDGRIAADPAEGRSAVSRMIESVAANTFNATLDHSTAETETITR